MKKIFIVDYENTAIHGLMGIDKLDKESLVEIALLYFNKYKGI